jgi:PEGA domain
VRVREVAAIAANGVIVLVLSGCSSATAPSWVPSWMTIKPEPQALRFESAPPGADVTVNVGPNQSPQTCKTPCSLTLPLSQQSVTVALNGYEPQTVAVGVQGAKDFDPNPVRVTLQAVHPKSHRPKSAKPAATPDLTPIPSPTTPGEH